MNATAAELKGTTVEPFVAYFPENQHENTTWAGGGEARTRNGRQFVEISEPHGKGGAGSDAAMDHRALALA